MSIPSTISNVLIEGNTVEAGNAFNYNYIIFTSSDCRIMNNYFSGIKDDVGASVMLWLTNGTNNISGNTFVRGSSSINAYIVNIGSYDQIITDNIFDSSTSDGSSQVLASNLTATSLYDRNKNQTGYSIVPLGTNKPAIFHFNAPVANAYSIFQSSDLPPTGTNDIINTSSYLYDMMMLKIFDTESSPTSQKFTASVDITKSVPFGAKIVDIQCSLYNPSGGSITLSTGNSFTLALNKSRDHVDSINITTYLGTSTANWNLLYTTGTSFTMSTGSEFYPAYHTLDLNTTNYTGTVINNGSTSSVTNQDISNNYVVNSDGNIIANLAFTYEASGTGTAATPLLLISPIVVTYVW